MEKVFVVGQLKPDFGDMDIEIVGQSAPVFPESVGDEMFVVMSDIAAEAHKAEANAIVFSALAGQVAAWLTQGSKIFAPFDIGVVISAPGERPARITHHFEFTTVADAEVAASAVSHINPNAKIKVRGRQLDAIVDPPMKFNFSHIEWLKFGGYR